MKIALFDAHDELISFFRKGLPYSEFVTFPNPIQSYDVAVYRDAEVVSVEVSSHVSADMLTQLPRLKHIATRSTGFDHIDLVQAEAQGIIVTNVPDYGSHTVAEFGWALLLELLRRPALADQALREGDYDGFDFTRLRGIDVYNKTIGVVGTGKIGRVFAEIARGFGATVLLSDVHPDPKFAKQIGANYVDFDELLRQSDIVSLHVPLLPATRHMINTEALAKFKLGAYLINVSRGAIIDTNALLAALDDGRLGGVALDVLEQESTFVALRNHTDIVPKDSEIYQKLINHPQVMVTPHVAFYTIEAERRIWQTTIENIQAIASGTIQNTV